MNSKINYKTVNIDYCYEKGRKHRMFPWSISSIYKYFHQCGMKFYTFCILTISCQVNSCHARWNKSSYKDTQEIQNSRHWVLLLPSRFKGNTQKAHMDWEKCVWKFWGSMLFRPGAPNHVFMEVENRLPHTPTRTIEICVIPRLCSGTCNTKNKQRNIFGTSSSMVMLSRKLLQINRSYCIFISLCIPKYPYHDNHTTVCICTELFCQA